MVTVNLPSLKDSENDFEKPIKSRFKKFTSSKLARYVAARKTLIKSYDHGRIKVLQSIFESDI